MKILYYKFQCNRCFIVSGNVSKDQGDVLKCCGGEPMVAIPVYEYDTLNMKDEDYKKLSYDILKEWE